MSIGILASAHVPFATGGGYADEVLADSPLVYWPLNELSGSVVYDLSGNDHDGDYYGSPTLGVTGLTNAGTAVTLDGTDDRVQADYDASWMLPASFSAEIWIESDGTGVANGDVIMSMWNGSGWQRWTCAVRTASTGEIEFFVRTSNYYGLFATGLLDGNPHHIVCTYSSGSGTMVLYVDGVQAGTRGASSPLNGSGTPGFDLLVGARNQADPGKTIDTAKLFPGTVDQFAYYDTALSAARILAHFNAA